MKIKSRSGQRIKTPSISLRRRSIFAKVPFSVKNSDQARGTVEGCIKSENVGKSIPEEPVALGAPSLFSKIREKTKGNDTAFLYLILVSFALIVPNITFTLLTRVFIDGILIEHFLEWKLWILAGMAGAIVCNVMLLRLQTSIATKLCNKVSGVLTFQFLWSLFQLPEDFFLNRSCGEVSSRLFINDKMSRTLIRSFKTISIDCCLSLIYGLVIICFDYYLALIAFSFVLINLCIMRAINRGRVKTYAKLQKDYGRLITLSMGIFRSIESIKVCGMENYFFSRWAAGYSAYLNSMQKTECHSDFLHAIPHFIKIVGKITILAVGALEVIEGSLSIGMLVASQLLMMRLMGPFGHLLEVSQKIRLLHEDLSRLDDVVEFQKKTNGKEVATDPTKPLYEGRLTGSIEIKNLSFNFDSEMPRVIQDISLKIDPGTCIALVGRSGCGKSTFVKLLSGLLNPDKGEILFDGMRRDEISKRVFYDSIGVVQQEIFIFKDTVKNNITMMDQTVSEKKIQEICESSRFHRGFLAKGRSINQSLFEQGKNISGGERQLLGITRALIKRPAILIMDEATSSLDIKTEKEVMNNIRRLGCTTILIAHRITQIEHCDEVIIMDEGRIVRRGTHETLKQTSTLYCDLLNESV